MGHLANSFLQRLFAKKKRHSDAKSLSFKQQNRSPLEPPHVDQNAETKKKVNALFAFVDLKDPFTPSEIAGEELPGPILSILSAKQFDSVFLLYTPQTRENAVATMDEIERRHKGCRVKWQPVPVSDPKDYSLMGSLWRYGGDLLRRSDADENYVCVSSGTAEMRAAWFVLTTLGIVKAKLLQVSTPTQPLFGKVYVKELRLDTVDWQAIQDLALPAESSDTVTLGPKLKDTVRSKNPRAGAETFGFDSVFVERMRTLYGDPLTNLLPGLSRKFLSRRLSPHSVLAFTEESLRRVAVVLGAGEGRQGLKDVIAFRLARRAIHRPESFAAFVNSICNNVLLEYYQAQGESWPAGESQQEAPDVLNELKLKPKQLEALRLGMPTEAVEEEESILMGEPEASESRFVGVGPEGRFVPGLDDALQELGIYVGSAVLGDAAERAGIAAGSHLPVLLLGETGTGKERFAHLIHRLSPRFPRELVAINCAAIPEPIAESYLFGHVKGAFTGADSDKKGMFESADQSTLFLDEIAELTLEVQAKLLRVIQDSKIQRLGSMTPTKVDVRIIAASNRDLRKEVSAGRFRKDLYFRLEVVQIKLPALRERRSEIPELALALLRQINLRRHNPRQLSSAALMRLEKYDWPGNVRQLSNVLERSVLYARCNSIDADDLITEDEPGKDPFAALPHPFKGFKVEQYLMQAREHFFLWALAACKGNQTEAAELLGVSKQAVSKFVAGQNDNVD